MSDRRSRPSCDEVRAVCRKGDAEPFWISRFLIRPWTPYLSFLALRLGVSPSQITVVSAVLAVSAGMITLWPSTWSYVGSAILTSSFFVLDHVDGEVARVLQSRHPVPPGTLNLSGKYLDRLVHYLQAPTLFLGITCGIAVAEGRPVWAVVGIVCALGSSGFPRFTASYDLLVAASRSTSGLDRAFLARAAGFSMIYGEDLLRRGFVLVPRNAKEVLAMGRQYVGFPGNLFVLSGALVIDGVRLPQGAPHATKLVVGVYAAVLTVNLIYATRRYFVLLKDVPE